VNNLTSMLAIAASIFIVVAYSTSSSVDREKADFDAEIEAFYHEPHIVYAYNDMERYKKLTMDNYFKIERDLLYIRKYYENSGIDKIIFYEKVNDKSVNEISNFKQLLVARNSEFCNSPYSC